MLFSCIKLVLKSTIFLKPSRILGADDAYDTAVEKLTSYLESDKNRIYQACVFHQTVQGPSETIDVYHSRFRGLAKFCEFHNEDFEIKMQLVLQGTSSCLRKRALRDPGHSLADMLIDGCKAETSHAQTGGIESQSKELQVNNLSTKSNLTCFNCAFNYPQKNKLCSARNATCNFCSKQGHFAKVCRSKADGNNQGKGKQPPHCIPAAQPSKSRSKSRHKLNHHTRVVQQQGASSSDSSSDDNYVYTVETKKRGDPRTKVTLRVNHVHHIYCGHWCHYRFNTL